MKIILNLPKKGTKVFTIENCKIEEYYVESVSFYKIVKDIINKDLSQNIIVKLERYNDKINSYKTEKTLSNIFLTKEELIKQL